MLLSFLAVVWTMLASTWSNIAPLPSPRPVLATAVLVLGFFLNLVVVYAIRAMDDELVGPQTALDAAYSRLTSQGQQ